MRDRLEVTVESEGRLDNSTYNRWFTTNRVEDSSDVLTQARQLSGALFLQSTVDVGYHLRFTLGGRFDELDTRDAPVGDTVASASHGIFSPKLGALLHVPRLGDIYANVSRGFRSTDGVIEDPTLPFITEWAYEAGTHVYVGDVTASAALFQIDVSNEQTFDPVTLTSNSGGRSRRQGLELSLNTPLGQYARVNGSWTFTNARYLDQVSQNGVDLNNARVANTARYVGEAAINLGKTSAAWSVRLRATSSARTRPSMTRAPNCRPTP